MNKIILISSIILLSACGSTSNRTLTHTLVNDNGNILSYHKSQNDCQGTAIIANIRKVNDWNSKKNHGSHQRTPVKDGALKKVSCK
jgi:hypothetical protein